VGSDNQDDPRFGPGGGEALNSFYAIHVGQAPAIQWLLSFELHENKDFPAPRKTSRATPNLQTLPMDFESQRL
jgi:hypothetical protein